MANFNLNYTNTYAGTFIATGSAVSLSLPFAPDALFLYNYTKSGTAGQSPVAVWFDGFPAGDAIVMKVIADNGSTGNQNLNLETSNGVTDASTAAGVTASQVTITGATAANPCVITAAGHGLSTGDRITITKVLGMTELNAPERNPYVVTVLSSSTFSIADIYGNDINSTSFTAYSSGGQLNKTGLAANFEYLAPTYALTLGTAVAGNDSDVFYFIAYSFGAYENLGDAANF